MKILLKRQHRHIKIYQESQNLIISALVHLWSVEVCLCKERVM